MCMKISSEEQDILGSAAQSVKSVANYVQRYRHRQCNSPPFQRFLKSLLKEDDKMS